MTRRKNIKRSKIRNNTNPKDDMRFKISLLILIALLCSSVFFLLIILNRNGEASLRANSMAASEVKFRSNMMNRALAKNSSQVLENPTLGFRVKIPTQLGDWIYRVGYVKSPVDDSLANHYLKIFVPIGKKSGSKNFEENYQEILSVRKYSNDEWTKLEKGCEKGNLFYCEVMGEKISEDDGQTYTCVKTEKCRREVQSKCEFSDQIMESFQLD
ncbi:MAG: hypothetical protein A3J76_00440 [Candidatus Moranbacteria bacterium RBG_13_45_13]|nr:MAG: hypothetical protein A3J76_00440 [Candidatus Moranbacteria bacterium RBG_13_45_13]